MTTAAPGVTTGAIVVDGRRDHASFDLHAGTERVLRTLAPPDARARPPYAVHQPGVLR